MIRFAHRGLASLADSHSRRLVAAAARAYAPRVPGLRTTIRRRRRHSAWRAPALLLVLLAVAVPAQAGGPIEHEYIKPDPVEDLRLNATTRSGSMPAALETPSGVVTAPDTEQNPAESGTAYGGGSTPNSVDATYRIDRDTTRPDEVGYDDPFSPAVTPFKRLYAFDAVDPELELVVANKRLRPIPVGGSVQAGDDQFYGDMAVDLTENTPVRIPSVGPGPRVLAATVDPPLRFQLYRDGADNWFIKAAARKRVRLTLQLAIPRSVFGSSFADVSWQTLAGSLPKLPDSARTAAQTVLDELGVSQAITPRAAVAMLVAHFRDFQPSSDLPKGSGAALYQELALSQKGVCRHRAYAFTITALVLGLPTRMIRNEAHAWVEVYDGSLWHRIDLGGAAGRLDMKRDDARPVHSPPRDPYSWPKGSGSGLEMADHARTSGSQPGGSSSSAASSSSAKPAEHAEPTSTPADTAPSADDKRPPAELSLTLGESHVRRGEPLKLRGRVVADGDGCPHARVDVKLATSSGRTIPIGSLATDDSGRFSGAVVVPLARVDVGDYDVMVSTPGDARCGPGSAD